MPSYKPSSTSPDETSNSTSPPPPQPPIPRSAARSRLNPRVQTRRMPPYRRRANFLSGRTHPLLIPSEFLSSSYNTTPPRIASLKPQRLILVLTPSCTSNRPKGSYRMSLALYSDKMGCNIPHSILITLFPASRANTTCAQLTSASLDDISMDDPGLVTDNQSRNSEDSILSDPEWISNHRQLAMELLLGSTEDEFIASFLGSDSLGESSSRAEELSNELRLCEEDDSDLAGDGVVEGHAIEESNPGAPYVLREVDEDYDL